MPYLADKVLDMLFHILKKGNEDEEGTVENHEEDEIDFGKLLVAAGGQEIGIEQIMRSKINAVGRMRRMYKNLKEN